MGELCACKAFEEEHEFFIDGCLSDIADLYCGDCGQPCETHTEDYGFGPGEAWGVPYNHVNVQTVSDCCESDIFEDASLRRVYNHEEYLDED